ncbi:hypothetical protein QM716_15895 [Rhodococcus sp. IEGM 1409]|uniref:hypothetical protein n=1 Tax=Rhodococcus sp. IEGM 1409 TaxID=3047082 RepID=UPI0024B83EA3|nr:hypothetical protein [Rhodococcus sp. IEGM 1409]MDI9901341.1 hypothetical protein [Rhodococcus sp. IEGM 1409]
MSAHPTLREMAFKLDTLAIELADKGKHREARTAISLAIALENRQQQINASDFNRRGVVDDR